MRDHLHFCREKRYPKTAGRVPLASNSCNVYADVLTNYSDFIYFLCYRCAYFCHYHWEDIGLLGYFPWG